MNTPPSHIKPGTLVREIAVIFNEQIPPNHTIPAEQWRPWYNVEPTDLPNLLPSLALNQMIRFRGGIQPDEILHAIVYLRDPAKPEAIEFKKFVCHHH